jgi:hypothetical protein
VGQPGLEALVERQAVVDVVVRYATGIDMRDWTLYASCFTDPCEFDFSSWSGRPAAMLTPEQWTTGVRSLNGNFDSTQHLSTNHVVTFQGQDEATCVSYMHAQHWFSAERLAELGHGGDEARWCTLGGYYTNTLRRDGDGWRIRRCQLNVTWVTGDRSIFDIARSLGDPG